jgi:hypothetical protein
VKEGAGDDLTTSLIGLLQDLLKNLTEELKIESLSNAVFHEKSKTIAYRWSNWTS